MQIKDLAKKFSETNLPNEGGVMASPVKVSDTVKDYLDRINYKIGDLMTMLERLEEIESYLLGVEREPKGDASNEKNNQSVMDCLVSINNRLGLICQSFEYKFNRIQSGLH